MELHPLAARFADVAGAYERGRPEYPPAVVRAIAAELGIAQGEAVLDLAAGTGKFTRALLGIGMDVIAVEPQPPLREILAASIGKQRVGAGVAEAIPLEDASVAAVTVADAFHWFDHAVALAEIQRVLRPGGGLAIVTTVPGWNGASWAHDVGKLIADLRPEHPRFDGMRWQDSVLAAKGWSAPREIRLTAVQPADAEGVVDYLSSVSWIAALPESQRDETLARLGAIVNAGETPAELPLDVVIGLTVAATERER
jgi:SAM-dependent methyltransferase